MKNKKNNLEEQITRALLNEAASKQSSDISNECLSNELICHLCEGELSEIQQQKALEHLDKCQQCRTDLAFYYELVGRERANVAIKLKKLISLLPSLAKKLDKKSRET